MTAVIYAGPSVQVVPEMGAQDGPGTLILRPGQHYDFPGSPPGDPAWWVPVPPAPPAAKALPAPVPAPAPEG